MAEQSIPTSRRKSLCSVLSELAGVSVPENVETLSGVIGGHSIVGIEDLMRLVMCETIEVDGQGVKFAP